MDNFKEEYLKALREIEKEELEKYEPQIQYFKKIMKDKGIKLTDDNFNFYQTSGIIVSFPNIVNLLVEDLVIDKDGLINFDELNKTFVKKTFFNGYLFHENFVLMANSYFRREFHEINNYAPRFIEYFWESNDSNVDHYISIDMDRVRIDVNGSPCLELIHGMVRNSIIKLI